MKKVWEFFDNLNEYVYVSDMDNYELIYMNQKTLNDFGFSSKCCRANCTCEALRSTFFP